VSKRKIEYPADEFDLPRGALARTGVHRAGRSAWSGIWPFILVFILTFAIGVGVVYYLMQVPGSKIHDLFGDSSSSSTSDTTADTGDEAGDSSNNTAPDSADGTTAGDSNTSDEAAGYTTNDSAGGSDASETATDPAADGAGTDDATESDSADAGNSDTTDAAGSINHAVTVRVVNASTVTGAAAKQADKLKSDGFGSVEAANFDQGEKPTSSVVYYKGAQNKATAERVGEVTGISRVVLVDSLRADISVVLR